jgi:RHS repeat-associated protein
MTYDDDNRLATVNGSSVTVDLDGNLTSGPLPNGVFTNYTFDARNRLITVEGTSSTSPTTNAYDAMNNRIGQIYGTNSIAYVVNPNAKLPQVLMRIKNGVTNYYIYGAGLLYQVTETATATNTLTYHYDYRGSTVALTGDNGLVTDRIEYSTYGLTTYRVGTADTPFLFNGRYGVHSDSNGLLYMRARYYNPYLCRFISQDPSGFAGGLNWFAYANGNPVSYLDPFGLGAIGEDSNMSWLTPTPGQPIQFSQLPGEQSVSQPPPIATEDTSATAGNQEYWDWRNGFSSGNGLNYGLQVANEYVTALSIAAVLFPPTDEIGDIGLAAESGVPSTLARVVDARLLDTTTTLGRPGAADVFVTSANDIAGINNSAALAQRLTLMDSAGNMATGPFAVIQFDTPASGLASPVFRNNPGFIQGGLPAEVQVNLSCPTCKLTNFKT